MSDVTPEQVGQLYDQLTPLFEMIWGENVHVGYWPDEATQLSVVEAQEFLTELLLQRLSLQKQHRLLDVGCGLGRPAIRIADATGCSVSGVTISQYQAAEANRRVELAGVADRVKVIHADIMSAPFPDETFDAAMMFESLIHMPDHLGALRQVNRLLRPGGMLVIADQLKLPIFPPADEAFYCQAFKLNLFTGDKLREYLLATGFEILGMQDASENVKRIYPMTEKILRDKDSALRQVLGDPFIDGVGQVLPVINKMAERYTGYTLVTARKRAPAS